ncbi:MAG: hypothetical protein IIB81_04980, partial [Nanoarchaeota archaeon]|nr:hypothetical protein [Nanoarchaeota archaeon]
MPKSLGTTHVDGIHHYGLPSRELVVLDGHRRAGVYEIPISMGFKNHPSVPVHKGGMEYSVDYTIKGQHAFLRTSGNLFDFSVKDIQENGIAMGWDDIGIEKWRAVSELNNTVEYVLKPTGKSGLYEGEEYIPDYSKSCPSMTNVNVPISRWHGVNMDINKVGVGFSRIANAKEHLRNLTFDDYPKPPGYNSETMVLLERLDIGRKITAIGVENLENAAAAIYRHNGTSTLVESTYIHQKAQAIAQKYGLSG